MMDSTYYSILGWTIVLGGGGALWYYYQQPDGRQRAFTGRGARNSLPRVAAIAPPLDEQKRKKQKQDRPRPASRPSEPEAPAPQPQYDEREEKEDLSWAHQLAQKKQGTTLAPPARAANRARTVKQSGANGRAAELTADSSTGDTDDDSSPAVSPVLNGQASGRDVSDMLEPTARGPAVLKVMESTNPKKEKPKQQPKKVVEQETKRQRQNKKKAEEKKAADAAIEQARRVQMEAHRRSAREARGEPAKNGLGISAAPANNAWKATNGSAAPAVSAPTNGQLLDTFTNDDTTTTESTAPTSVSTSPVQPVNEKWWTAEMPSEEDQRRMLLEQDENAWTTVSTKSKKTKTNGVGAVQPVEAS